MHIPNALTPFGLECNGDERNVSQCIPLGTHCRAVEPDFAVAIECGGAMDGSECHYLHYLSHRIYDVASWLIYASKYHWAICWSWYTCRGIMPVSIALWVWLGICKLCWHNFKHYRDVLAIENNASIIDLFTGIIDQLLGCSKILKQACFCSDWSWVTE